MTCPGSFGLSLQLPDAPSSSYAEEGNRLHDVAELMISDDSVVREVKHADMEAVMSYVLWCRDLIKEASAYGVEEYVAHSELLGGTPDFWAVVDDTLNVVDLKTGAGIAVSPEGNYQLMVYAYMIMKKLDPFAPKMVRITIVQPPISDEPQHWHISADELMSFGEDMQDAISEAIGGSTHLVPGEHCRWCKAKPTCPKLLGTVTEALPIPVATLKPALLGEWLNKAELLQQWLDALRERGHQLAQAGQEIPGWKLKPKRATRQWVDDEKVLEIARRRKIKIWQDKLMSPAMAEKAHPNLPQELRDEIVAVSSGTNLVRDDNPSPRVEATPPTLQSALRNLIYRT
jgi:hypothetical protein